MKMYDLAVEGLFPSVQYGFLTGNFPRHEHAVWEIHLFTGGHGRLLQDGEVWAVSAGSLTVSPPGHAHELHVETALTFFYLQFAADRETLGPLRRLVERQEQGPLRVEPSAMAEAGRLKEKLDAPSADRVASGFHGFRAWLYDLAAGHAESHPDGIEQTLVWLRQNLDRPLSLDDLAAEAGLDKFAFCRRFKTRTGLSPLAYVHRSKVEAAGFLLAGTSLPLADVARQLGFCDEFHFGKVFKKWRGVSPGRWRRLAPDTGANPMRSSP